MIEKIKSNIKRILSILYFFLVLFVVVSLFVYILDKYNTEDYKNIIDLIKIIFSWPVLITIITLIFIDKFSESIKIFLENNRIIKVAGVEMESKQEINEKTDNIISGEESKTKKKQEEIDKLKIEIKKKTQNKANLKKLFNFQKEISEVNEFSYLALFFIETTKNVLKWFLDSKRGLITEVNFNSSWQVIIKDPNQRNIIFNTLINYQMIDGVHGGAYKITEKGEKFLKFIKYIN